MNSPITSDRLPPHDLEIEQAVLACFLLDNSTIKFLPRNLLDAFYDLRHRTTAEHCLSLHEKGAGVDEVTLATSLKDGNVLEQVGGLDFIAPLADRVSSAANFHFYFDSLVEKYMARMAVHTSVDLCAAIYEDPAHAAAIIENGIRAFEFAKTLTPDSKNGHLSWRSPDEIMRFDTKAYTSLLGDDFFCVGDTLSILGAGGIGKSRLCLQMIGCMILGLPFLKLPTGGKGTRWLILQAENGMKRLQKDLAAMREVYGPECWKYFSDHVVIHTLETESDGFFTITNADVQRRLKEALEQYKPDGVLIDAVYNVSTGDLNKDTDMMSTLSAVSRVMRHRNPLRSIMACHHSITGKAGAVKATGWDRASFARNSKVIHSWTRAQLNVSAGSDDGSKLVISCGKANNCEEWKPFACELHNDMMYWPDENFDFESWEQEISGKEEGPKCSERDLISLVRGRSMDKPQLVKALRDEFGIARGYAYKLIGKSEKGGAIRISGTTAKYYAP